MLFDRTLPDQLEVIRTDSGSDRVRGRDYLASEAVENAINVALGLGRPLLVSGAPGCGKSELGFAIARKLGIPRVHFFSAKSTSEATSLLYEYDTLGRFRAAQLSKVQDDLDPRRFVTYRALGRAILDAHGHGAVAHLIDPGAPVDERPSDTPTRSVVIVDEVDKAPRDFTNDLLNEIDQLQFRVHELVTSGQRAETPPTPEPHLRPIVVITSNLERSLPDPFLRRCVFHHLEFPEPEVRSRIVRGHLARMERSLSPSTLKAVLAVVDWARSGALSRQPGMAEAIDYASSVALAPGQDLASKLQWAIPALAKTEPDAAALRHQVPLLAAGA